MFRERSHLVLKDGELYKRHSVENSEKLQLVLQGFHNEFGHLGRDKILDLIRQ